jgi:MFS family permease
LRSVSSASLAIPRSEVAPLERWYVLIVVMCVVYAVNIAARYVVTTVFEPIRLELTLSDAGATFLTGVPLTLFYVVCGIPIASLADRSNRRNIVATSLVLWSDLHRVVWFVRVLLAAPDQPHRRGLG